MISKRRRKDKVIYITGDTHGRFEHIKKLCRRNETTHEDLLIILGDAGINYSGGIKDRIKKELLYSLPITILCIHGNHEMRPNTLPGYTMKEWQEGIVFVEHEYPNILFAKDGEIYLLNGKRTIAIGGACSVDKQMRETYGFGWWPDEQPSPQIKAYVERRLSESNWKVDVVLSHTAPLKYEPVEWHRPDIDQKTIDKSTEKWLEVIELKLNYKKWYCGHFHAQKKVHRLEIMYENIELFYDEEAEM
jgi:3-oxoacid CoA-transferase subunit A